jgi:hypothetical protein
VPDVARRYKDSKRVEGRNSPFQGPSGAGGQVTVYTWDAVRTGKEMTGIYQTTRCYNPEDSHLNILLVCTRIFFVGTCPFFTNT